MNGMKNKTLALDSNIFIYHFEEHPEYIAHTSQIFQELINASAHGLTSTISLIETLSYPAPPDLLMKIKERFKILPNLTIFDVTEEIAIEAAKIRRTYGFRLPDSVQLATAVTKKANTFITNDTRLKKFKEIKVALLEEF